MNTTTPRIGNVSYFFANLLRLIADTTGDPEDYRKAAAEFRALGMWLAAERCEEKARNADLR